MGEALFHHTTIWPDSKILSKGDHARLLGRGLDNNRQQANKCLLAMLVGFEVLGELVSFNGLVPIGADEFLLTDLVDGVGEGVDWC